MFALKFIADIEEARKKILVISLLYYIILSKYLKSKKYLPVNLTCGPPPQGRAAAGEMAGTASFLQGYLLRAR